MSDDFWPGMVLISNGNKLKKVENLVGKRISMLAAEGELFYAACLDGTFEIDTQDNVNKICDTPFKYISAGKGFVAGIKDSGSLYTWGTNGENGQLGQGAHLRKIFSPMEVNYKANFARVSCGESHSMALDEDGRLYAWGENFDRQLIIYRKSLAGLVAFSPSKGGGGGGRGAAAKDQYRMQPMIEEMVFSPRLSPWSQDRLALKQRVLQLACGPGYSLAIVGGGQGGGEGGGQVYAWGSGLYGQLGQGQACTRSDLPRLVRFPDLDGGLLGIREVAAGTGHVLAIDDDGNVHTWGLNHQGQCGLGSPSPGPSPSSPAGLGSPEEEEREESYHPRILAQRIRFYSPHRIVLGLGLDQQQQPGEEELQGQGEETSSSQASASSSIMAGAGERERVRARRVICGGHSSALIDSEGRLFTWGSNDRERLLLLAYPASARPPLNAAREALHPSSYPAYLTHPCLVAGQPILAGLRLERFVFSAAAASPACLLGVRSQLSSLRPVLGPRRGFSSLTVFGYGLWQSDKILVKFTPRQQSIYNPPRSVLGRYATVEAQQAVVCRPPCLAEVGDYSVTVSMDGGHVFLPQSFSLFVYKELAVLSQLPAVLDLRDLTSPSTSNKQGSKHQQGGGGLQLSLRVQGSNLVSRGLLSLGSSLPVLLSFVPIAEDPAGGQGQQVAVVSMKATAVIQAIHPLGGGGEAIAGTGGQHHHHHHHSTAEAAGGGGDSSLAGHSEVEYQLTVQPIITAPSSSSHGHSHHGHSHHEATTEPASSSSSPLLDLSLDSLYDLYAALSFNDGQDYSTGPASGGGGPGYGKDYLPSLLHAFQPRRALPCCLASDEVVRIGHPALKLLLQTQAAAAAMGGGGAAESSPSSLYEHATLQLLQHFQLKINVLAASLLLAHRLPKNSAVKMRIDRATVLPLTATPLPLLPPATSSSSTTAGGTRSSLSGNSSSSNPASSAAAALAQQQVREIENNDGGSGQGLGQGVEDLAVALDNSHRCLTFSWKSAQLAQLYRWLFYLPPELSASASQPVSAGGSKATRRSLLVSNQQAAIQAAAAAPTLLPAAIKHAAAVLALQVSFYLEVDLNGGQGIGGGGKRIVEIEQLMPRPFRLLYLYPAALPCFLSHRIFRTTTTSSEAGDSPRGRRYVTIRCANLVFLSTASTKVSLHFPALTLPTPAPATAEGTGAATATAATVINIPPFVLGPRDLSWHRVMPSQEANEEGQAEGVGEEEEDSSSSSPAIEDLLRDPEAEEEQAAWQQAAKGGKKAEEAEEEEMTKMEADLLEGEGGGEGQQLLSSAAITPRYYGRLLWPSYDRLVEHYTQALASSSSQGAVELPPATVLIRQVAVCLSLDGSAQPPEALWPTVHYYAHLGRYSLYTAAPPGSAVPKGGYPVNSSLALLLEDLYPLGLELHDGQVTGSLGAVRLRGQDAAKTFILAATFSEIAHPSPSSPGQRATLVAFTLPAEAPVLTAIGPVLQGKEKWLFVDVSPPPTAGAAAAAAVAMVFEEAATPMIQIK